MGTETMRAVRVHEHGGPERLVYEEVPRPSAGAGEVLVRVHAAGVNPADWYARGGFTNIARELRPVWPLPFTPGYDVSGVVVAVGAGVAQWAPGDEVFGLVAFPGTGSAYAEYVSAPAGDLARKPASLDHVAAAAAPLAGLTAYQFLFEHIPSAYGDLVRGSTVLVNGAAGGVGHFAVQLARVAGAVRVTGVASGRHEAFLKDLGVDSFVDYTKTPVEDVVREVDLLVDAVGGPDGHRLLPVLRRGGHIAPVFLGEYDPERAASLGITVQGWQVRSSGPQLAELGGLLESGRVRVGVDSVFPLSAASEAHVRAERGHIQGKIVLRVVE
ncbi:NADP-dependent oxidoreductase [Streptomyces sp. NPDC050658]|uniref:NADP-dependent oxidoreductase n=1 Tax=unclassified Streptomyces TaxID=2593676 RepID=UPI00343D84F6